MKRNWQRVLSLVLAFAVVAGLFPAGFQTAAASESAPTFVVGNTAYNDLGDAITAAQSGDGLIVVTESGTISGDYTIPANVTLLLPYADDKLTVTDASHDYPYANVEFYISNNNECAQPGGAETNVTLTLADGASLNVAGKLILGGVVGSTNSAAKYSGQTALAHSDMVLNGNSSITVSDGGVLSCLGYITGTGSIEVVGGTLYQPFVITDYKGGTYTVVVYRETSPSQAPFNSYAMMNIQTKVTFDLTNNATAMYGYCDLYTGAKSIGTVEISAKHNTCCAKLIGSTGSSIPALFMASQAVVMTYDAEKVSSHRDKAGKSTLELFGDAKFGVLTLKVYLTSDETPIVVDTTSVFLPIPYSLDIIQRSGTLTIQNDNAYKVLPGASVVIDEGAKLVVNGELAVYDGIKLHKMEAAVGYPDSSELGACGFHERGRLIVNGEMYINGSFGGIVETTTDGSETSNPKIVVASGLTSQNLSIMMAEGVFADDGTGITAGYTDRTERTLTARVYNAQGKEFIALEGGKTYYGNPGSGTLQSFKYNLYTDTTNYTEQTVYYTQQAGKTVEGTWATGFTITWMNGTTVHHTSAAYVPGAVVSETVQDPQKTGHTFSGWDQSTPATMPRNDLVINALWDANTYQVTFDANGGLLNTAEKVTVDVTFGAAYTLPDVTPVREGYEFVGWFDSGNNQLQAAAVKTTVGNETYTAKWEAKEYTLTFNGNGGTFDGAAKYTITDKFGAQVTAPADPTRTGYTFAGWHVDGAAATVAATIPAKNIEYVAQWTPNTYTVSFYDGETLKGSGTVTYGAAYGDVLPDLTKEGYTFAGWFTSDGTQVKADTLVATAEDHQLYAKWGANEVTLTFVDEDGTTILQTFTQSYGTALPEIVTPTREGYTFTGWDKTVPATMPAANTTYKATWKINQYTITFDTAGGTVINSITQDYNTPVTVPGDPTKAGHTFAGWDVAVPSVMPANNLTITAKWTVNQYTIVFDTKGGSTIEPITLDYGAAVTAPADPTKPGYTFAGWDVEIPGTMPVNGLTITAGWTANTYTVTFDGNGNTGGAAMADQSFTYGTAQNLSANSFTRTGYHFIGWAETKDGAVKYSNAQSVSDLTTEAGGNVILYAKWEANTYTVKYSSNGGTGGATEDQVVSYGVAFTLAGNGFTRAGYEFTGWNTKQDGSGTGYQAGQEVSDLVTSNNGSITLYAQWEAAKYTLTLDANGGEFYVDGTPYEQFETELSVSDQFALPVAYRTGYTLEGWYAGETRYEPGNAIVIGQDLALTAKWVVTAEDAFAISYNLNSGAWPTNADGTQNAGPVSYTVEDTFTLPTPVRTGYTFVGWSTDGKAANAQQSVTVEKGTTGNLTYVAHWTINQYTITFDSAGGSAVGAITQKYNAAVTAPADPTREGYTFAGWDVEIPAKMPAENMTITARWTVNSYDVIWDVDGVKTTVPYEYGATIAKPADPTKEGYTFAGWEGYTDGAVMGAADVTYKATWTVNSYDIIWDVDGVKTTVSYKYGETVVKPADPTKAGYTFAGWTPAVAGTMGAADVTYTATWTVNYYVVTWNVDGQETEHSYAYGAAITPMADPVKTGYTFAGWDTEIPAAMPAEDLTITATWTANQYTIVFDTQGGSTIEPITLDYGAAVTAPANPTKPGYTFAGWDVEIPATMPVNGLTITAKWTANEYTVTFHANTGSTSDLTGTQALTYDVQGVLNANVFERVGYTFAGWNTASDGSGTAYADKAAVENLAESGNFDLYAQWTPKTYTITFHANGGTGTMGTLSITYGQAAKPLSSCGFALLGHAFAGWNTKQDGSGTAYADLQEVSDLTADMTLFAQWTPNAYRVVFDANGGTGTMTAQTFTYGISQNLVVNSFTKIGYSFAGWNTKADGSGNFYADLASVRNLAASGDVTLYAQWTINQYTISFEPAGGSAVEAITRDYGTVINPPQDPTKNGYVFAGWDVAVPATMPAENITLTAQWTSYLSLLVAIDPADLADGTVLATAREYYSKMDSAQLASYEADHAAHREALFVQIKQAATAELIESVKDAVPQTNAMLGDNGSGEPIATITVNDQQGVDIRVDDADYHAINMLSINFLPILFSNRDIWSIDFPVLANETDKEGQPLTPYGNGVDTLQQMDLMLRIAFATINEPEITGAAEKLTYSEFYDWLTSKQDSLTIGVLDGRSIEITVIAKTPEGVEYSVDYSIAFYNNEHDVTWEANNGSEPVVETYSHGDALTVPTPIREGYTFAGWLDGNGNAPVAIMGKTDLTYTAQWTINQYTITFDTQGGTAIEAITQDYGTTVTAPAAPTREGYTFAGWDVEIPATMPAKDMTVTARWTINQYTITFDTADGTVIEAITQDYGTTVTAPADPTREGYTFAGWDTEIPAAMPAKDMTITAKWTPNTYIVTLDPAGGTLSGGSKLTVTYDAQFGLPNPTREGYTFAGWFLDGVKVESTDAVKITADATLTAQWEVGESYTVQYDLAGGQWPTGTIVTEVYNVDTPAFTLPVPVREGYIFTGWTGSNGDTPELSVTVSAGSTGERSYAANWKVAQYTITFDTAGGTEIGALTLDYGAAVTAPADPTREGYTFAGWDMEIPAAMPAKDMTITAAWTINQYTITFDAAGGTEVGKITLDYGAAVTAPADPTREGYTFAGWDMEIPAAMPAKDLTVTAKWTVNRYTITFNTAGGSSVAAITQDYGTTVTAPANPTREGYTFAGWDAEIPATMPAGDMTITAKWSLNAYRLVYLVDGEVYKEMTLNYGAAVAQLAEPVKEGYTFSGWSPAIPATMPGQDLTISGTFTAKQYQVSFAPNYPAAPTLAAVAVTFDSAYGTLPEISRVGYIFTGWMLDGAVVTEETLVRTAGDHTLTAAWEAITYQVTLDANGGSCNADSITVTYGGTYAELPVPVREGYTFVGWFDGDVQIDRETTVTITAKQTLVARWNVSGNTPYTVNHYQQNVAGDGYTLVDTEYLTGGADTETQAAQKIYTGFVFNASLGNTSGSIAANGSLVLNVYYDRETYDIVWYVGGGEIRETYRYGAQLSVPATAKPDDIHASYTFTGWDVDLPETVTQSATYTAGYSAHYQAVIGTVTYRTLALALANAKAGDMVVLADDAVISENLTVPAGVTLLIPCMDDDPGYVLRNNGALKFNPDGTNVSGSIGVGPDAALYRSLSITEGATLKVYGTVLVNAVTGRPAAGHRDQDITGGYAQIDLAGSIVIEDGGQLDCFGYIKGSGTVTALAGGTIADLYVVRNWRGGTQALKMYEADVYPMNEYDCHNIEADVRIECGGSYEGLVKMYAGDQYNYTRFPQVDNENGLIRLNEGAYLIRSYEEGREVFRIYGGAEFANSTLEIVGVDLTTAEFIYPIDGDIGFEVYNGRYDFNNDFKFLPGASFLVGSDAQLVVNPGITVVFYQEFNDLDNSGVTEYPSDRDPAVLSVERGGKFTNAGTFAGHIYTESTDILIGSAPQWGTQTREANGPATDAINNNEETWITIDHEFTMEHPELTWHYGENQSIVWEGLADYSAVQQAISSIPADLDYYEPESIVGIQPALDQVIYGLSEEHQAEVDAMAQPILDAVAALVLRKITVTFDPDGGVLEMTQVEMDCIGTFGTLPTPTREYHNFLGWYNEAGERIRSNDELKSKTDVTLTAKWEMDDADYTAVRKALRDIPSDEERALYTEESLAVLDAARAAVVSGLTADRQDEVDAMAKNLRDAIDGLEYRKVTVTLDANGGTVDPETLEVEYTQKMGDLPVPVRTGYEFAGWFTVDGVEVTAETEINSLDPITLIAQWTVNRYTVTWVVDGVKTVETYQYGAVITKPADPGKEGYTFTGWSSEVSETMGAANVTYTAQWTVNKYTVTWIVDGVETTETYDYGAEITAPADPEKKGYQFTGWSPAIPANMPSGDMTFTAQWKRVNPFVDVKEGAYYYDAVLWAVDEGITTGKTATTFEPNTGCTRAHVVMFLWRAAGCPEPEATESPFSDMDPGNRFFKPIMWAYENGITAGYEDGTFKPNATCSRAHIAMFLWRAAGQPEPELTESPFTDMEIGNRFAKPILWLYENGITTGKTTTTFAPNNTCTRGQIVTFLYRMMVEQGIDLAV